MAFLNFLMANKTKLLGGIIVGISFIQSYPGLRDLLSDTAYSWLMFVAGLIAVVFGFLNNPPVSTHKEGQ